MESNSKKSKSSFHERQRSMVQGSFKQVLLDGDGARFDCCRLFALLQMLQSAGAVSRYMPRRRDAQTRTQTQMQADADAAAFSSATTWLGQRGVVRIYQLLQSENAVSQDTAHRRRPLLWFSGSGHGSFVFCAPQHGCTSAPLTRPAAEPPAECEVQCRLSVEESGRGFGHPTIFIIR